MKQASKKSNQQQAPKSNDTPIGAMSITAILKELSKASKSDVSNIQKLFYPKNFDKVNDCIIKSSSLIKTISNTLSDLYNLTLYGYISSKNVKTSNTDEVSSKLLVNINQTLKEIHSTIKNNFNQTQIPGKKSFKDKATDFVDKTLFGNQINEQLIATIDTTNILVSSVISNQEIIIDYIKKLSENRKDNKSSKSGKKTKIIVNTDLSSVLDTLKDFQKEFKKNFVDLFEKFVNAWKEFTDEKLGKKFTHIISSFQFFNAALRITGIQLARTRNLFKGLLKSIVLLSLALIFPPFTTGFMFLLFMIKSLQLSCGGKKGFLLMKSMKGLGMGIMMVVAGAMLMSKVEVGNIVKLVFALTAIAGVLRLFDKNKNSTVPGKSSISKNSKTSVKVGGIFSAALGIMLLLWAVSFVRQIDWNGAGAMLLFIAGLSLILFLFNRRKYGKKGPMDSLLNISLGITILLLCADAANEVDWTGALKIIAFIFAIGLTLAISTRLAGGQGPMKGLFGFALGITILLLCVDATDEIDWDNAWEIIKFIFAVNLAIGLANRLGGKGKKNTGMLGFAFGLALVLLAIDAASEVDFKPGWQLVKIIGAILLLLVLSGKKLKGTGKLLLQIGLIALAITIWSGALWVLSKVDIQLSQVLLFALTIGIIIAVFNIIAKKAKRLALAGGVLLEMMPSIYLMIIATFAISIIPVAYESLLFFVFAAAAMIGIMYFISKIGKEITKGSLLVFAMVGSILLMAFAAFTISLITPNWEAFGFFCAVAAASALLTALFGLFFAVIGIGAVAMLITGVALLTFAISLGLLSAINVNWEAFGFFCAVAGSLILLLTLYAVTSPILLIGSVIMIFVGFAMIIVATSLFIISSLDISEEQITTFGNCLNKLIWEIVELTIPAALAVVGSILLIIVAVATIIVASALYIVSELKINVENIKKFGKGIIKLTEAYEECGIWAITKAVAKSLMLLIIAAATMPIAIALWLISKLNIDENKIDKFGVILSKFISLMCDVVSQHAKEIENNKEAFKIIADMANAAGSILNVVEQMANMTVAVWGTDKQTGELKIISRRQINEKDFDLVSQNMGKVMKALIAPLSIIASNDEWWDFGDGAKVKNPFGKIDGFFGPKDDMSGVNRIKAIGDAFEKIPAIMQGFCDNPLLTDVTEEGEKKMQRLQSNIGIFFDTIVQCMNKLPQKSVLDSWFDGTADWLKDTVAPVFETSNSIIKTLSPKNTVMWEYSKTPLILSRIELFWSTTKNIAQHVDAAKNLKIDKTFATKTIEFYNEMDKLSTNSWLASNNAEKVVTIASQTRSLINNLSDTKAFSNINKNLSNTDKNIKNIVGNINKISLPKAQILEKNLRLLTQAKSQEALKDAIESLKEMIGLLKEVQEKQTQATQQQTEQAAQQFDAEQQEKENSKLSEDEKQTKLLTVLQNLESLMQGNGIHASVNLTGINEEIEQALYNCGLATGNNFSKTGLTVKW